MRCQHNSFSASVDVARILHDESADAPCRYTADVRIQCADCGVPMRFLGVPAGVDLNGAAVSVDGCEGRFAIAPKGDVLTVLDGAPVGFTVRKEK